jgi:hypothetical protein
MQQSLIVDSESSASRYHIMLTNRPAPIKIDIRDDPLYFLLTDLTEMHNVGYFVDLEG